MGLGNAAGFPERVALNCAWRMEGVQQGLDKVSDEENRVTRARRGRAEGTSGHQGGGELGGGCGQMSRPPGAPKEGLFSVLQVAGSLRRFWGPSLAERAERGGLEG